MKLSCLAGRPDWMAANSYYLNGIEKVQSYNGKSFAGTGLIPTTFLFLSLQKLNLEVNNEV